LPANCVTHSNEILCKINYSGEDFGLSLSRQEAREVPSELLFSEDDDLEEFDFSPLLSCERDD
jgi:hypothetical protein